MNPRFIVHHPRRLVYAELPKCASTTMHKLFLEISGIRTELEPHFGIWRETLAAERRAAGLEALEVDEAAIDEFVARHAGYRFFTVVRDPYSRCLSAYAQQVRRYAKRHRRLAFAWAKCRQAISRRLPEDVDNPHRVVTETLRAIIPLGEFVAGLRRHGPGFDKHFELQSRVIHHPRIRYDDFVKMEELAAGLRTIFADADAVRAIPALNVSRSDRVSGQLTATLRQTIHEVYAPDFDHFGYAA